MEIKYPLLEDTRIFRKVTKKEGLNIHKFEIKKLENERKNHAVP